MRTTPPLNDELEPSPLIPAEGTRLIYAGVVVESPPFGPEGQTMKAAFLSTLELPPDTKLYALDESQIVPRATLQEADARYKDLLNLLGVQGHEGAIAEIKSLREKAGLDKPKQDEKDKTFTSIPLDEDNRMFGGRIGKNKGRWFIRADLWFKAFRLAKVRR